MDEVISLVIRHATDQVVAEFGKKRVWDVFDDATYKVRELYFVTTCKESFQIGSLIGFIAQALGEANKIIEDSDLSLRIKIALEHHIYHMMDEFYKEIMWV